MAFVECADFNELKVRVDGLAGQAAAQPALKGSGGGALGADSCVMTCDEVNQAIAAAKDELNESINAAKTAAQNAANGGVSVAQGGGLSGAGTAASPLTLNLGSLVDGATLEVKNGKIGMKSGSCRLGVRDEYGNGGTVFQSDEIILIKQAGVIGVHKMPVGKQVLVIQAVEGEVTLVKGPSLGNLVAPFGGSLVLAGNGAAVTLVATGEDEVRVLGQTKEAA